MAETTLLIVDDHAMVRGGLRLLLADIPGITVLGEAGNGRTALELVASLEPDIVLLDVVMPGLDGIEVARRIAQSHPRCAVLVLSAYAAEDNVRDALSAGVRGYIVKSGSPRELELAIRAILRGEWYLSPGISKQVIRGVVDGNAERPDALERLTSRQREVLQLVAEGKSTKEIALICNSSVKTIEAHRAALMQRLGIADLASLVRFAVRRGVASADD
jgi:DNA-binding NarL/FixJ family response regulator